MIALDFASWMSQTVAGDLVLAIPVALLAGLVSFFSPCVLPLLPAYLSYATGQSAADIISGNRRSGRMLLGSLLFVLGFAVIFTITGAVFGGIGLIIGQYRRLIEIAAGALCIVLGLIFADVIGFGQQTLRPIRASRIGLAAAPLLGAAFAIGWTPCIGPTLGVVLTLALNESSSSKGAVLAFCYALGLGIPFIITGLLFHRLNGRLAWVKKHMRAVMWFGGGLLILVGLLLLSGLWQPVLHTIQIWSSRFGIKI